MSTSKWWQRFLLVALVSTVFSNGDGETVLRSTADKMKYGVSLGSPGVGKVKRQGGSYEPIRITPYYDASVDSKDSSIRLRIQEVTIPRILSFLNSTVMVRPASSPILIDRDCNNGLFFPRLTPSSPIRCFTTCASATMCGSPVTIPEEHLRECVQCNNAPNADPFSTDCETVGTDGPGVNDTDFVLYVTAMNIESCTARSNRESPSTIAFAAACAMEAEFDRPIAGYVNFCPSAFTSSSQVDDEFLFTVTKHEILHALAFSSSLFPFWRDEDGIPRTPREEANRPPIDPETGRFVISDTTIQVITYQDWIDTNSNIVEKTVSQLVTPNVVREGQQHFNCPTLTGVELEDFGSTGTALSHWEKRILGNEAMTGLLTDSPVFSRFTLALLEDSGWYRVNYDNAGTLLWGKDAGCIFATRSCQEYILDQRSNSAPISPFCSPTGTTGCTIARESIGQCSPLAVSDNCPVFQQLSNGDCTNPDNSIPAEENVYIQTYSNCSRCFEHGEVSWMTTRLVGPGDGAGCYQYTCSANQVTVFIGGEESSYTCDESGQLISVNADVPNIGEVTGSIICPSYEEICFDFDPQDSCQVTGLDAPENSSGNTAHFASINFFLLMMLLVLL